MPCRNLSLRALSPILLLACSVQFKEQGDDAVFADSGSPTDTSDSSDSATPVGELTVSGVVVDVLGLPLAGVEVSGNGAATTTAADGAFTSTGDSAFALTFTRPGLHTATRMFSAEARSVRVGLQPIRVATPLDADDGGSVTVEAASVVVPPAALGTAQIVTVTFDPFDLEGGMHSLPAGTQGESGQVASIYAAVTLEFAAEGAPMTPSAAVTVNLPLLADSPGASGTLLLDVGGVWTSMGSAPITLTDQGYVASFSVNEAGTYAVGRLDAAGCLAGTVVDGNGLPAANAAITSYLRPVATGVASYLGEAVSGEDGTFCAPGTAAGTTVVFDFVDTTSAHWSGAATSAAAGDPATCDACTDLGNVTLTLSGCATGNLYAADGSAMLPSPFFWEEGEFVSSDEKSTLTFYARAGQTFTLEGPGGLEKAFSVTSGTTVEAETCTRLGNLQATRQCVTVDVADADGPVEGAMVYWVDNEGVVTWTTTDDDGAVCLPSDNGTATYGASWTEGAQSVVVTQSADIDPAAGTCQVGECTAGPSLVLAGPGCVTGTILGDRGAPAEGVTVWSSSWDSTVTDASGSFSLTTAGVGVAAIWAEGWPVTSFTDPGAGAACKTVQLFTDAGAPPDLIVAEDKYIWRINSDGSSDDMLVSGAVVAVKDIDVDSTADALFALLNVYVWSGTAEGVDFDNFDYPSSLWSAMRVSPDHSMVGLQGFGSSNPAIWVYELDGTPRIKLSTTAAEDVDGLAFSADSAWLASTRKDLAVEVTPVNGSRGPATIAPVTCAKPVWFDLDTVALDCTGDVYLYEMDGSSSVSWLATGASERIWAVTSADRVVYTSDEELHSANIDLSDDVTLFTGSAGTTFSGIRVTDDGTWIGAIVNDPAAGVDVLAAADQAPYSTFWLTATPTETEAAIAWPD